MTNPSTPGADGPAASVALRDAKPGAASGDAVSLYIAVVGHVDHGKSTLVGRLLHEVGALPEGKLEAVEAMCRRRGMPFEWAFVTDALQAERDQGITIDVSHIRFSTPSRGYVLVDAPGHREFLKNMISGAALSDAALLVIDAAEGVREQSRRHGFLVHLLGIRQVVVAVNKMDAVGYDATRFADIEREYRAYLEDVGVSPMQIIPVSAREGDNIAGRSARTSWYTGPSVVEAIERFSTQMPLRELPLRIPVQDVYRFDDRRIIAGRIESGRLCVGDRLMFSPSNKTAVVKSIEAWNAPEHLFSAHAGQSVGFTLEEQIFVERGEVVSHEDRAPIETNVFRGRLFWLAAVPLEAGRQYTLKLGTLQTPVTVEHVEKTIDTSDLSSRATDRIERDAVGEVIFRSRALLALDPHSDNPRTGRFVLVDGYDVVAGGLVDMDGYPDQRPLLTVRSTNLTAVEHRVTEPMRVTRNGHAGGVIWFTGLSGAGKSTLAIELEQRLFTRGYHVYVLDGDNVRRGLNANLSFSPEDRAENIRRVGEVAALFADSGIIVITAFISPYRSDRDRARAAAGDRFREVFIKAPLDECERRDPKGLYAKARAGAIADFTGVSAPYESPETPDLVIDTASHGVEQSVKALIDFVEREFKLSAR